MTRVLRVPGAHPYVDACLGSVQDRDGGSPQQIPSPALDTDWLRAHHSEFDSVHLHFGFEHLSLEQLRGWLDVLAVYRLPLVLTVHDLRNPHQLSPEHHDRQLDALIPAADAIFTLTAGAAAEIHRRWNRYAEVLAHPFVIDPGLRPVRTSTGGLVGLHLKDLRRNVVDPDQVVAAVAQGAATAGARLRVDVHPGAAERLNLAGTRALAASGAIDLAVHPRFTDPELAEYLSGLDVFVLPYRFGSHSGWLEACRDVGTRVIAPSCGFYADQWSEVLSYRSDETSGLDGEELARTVSEALRRPGPGPADRQFRSSQLAQVQAVHARRHADLVAARGAGDVLPQAARAVR